VKLYNKKIVDNAAMSADIESVAYNVQQLLGYAIQAVFIGTPTGTLKLQASCDPATAITPGGSPVSDWTDIADSSHAISIEGDFMWNVSDVMYNWVRLVYTDASGGTSDGVLNVIINAKGF
jgi:hypothetical protein